MTPFTAMRVDGTSKPALHYAVRLHFDPVRQRYAILAPERIYWPDATALAILKLCNGKESLDGIVTSLSHEFEASREDIEADVMEFVQEWADRRLLKL